MKTKRKSEDRDDDAFPLGDAASIAPGKRTLTAGIPSLRGRERDIARFDISSDYRESRATIDGPPAARPPARPAPAPTARQATTHPAGPADAPASTTLRGRERDVATFDVSSEYREDRATIDGPPAGRLSDRQIRKARRRNPHWQQRLGFSTSLFGGGEIDSAELAENVAGHQAKLGLTVDGIAGPETVAAMTAAKPGSAGAGATPSATGADDSAAVAPDDAAESDDDAATDRDADMDALFDDAIAKAERDAGVDALFDAAAAGDDPFGMHLLDDRGGSKAAHPIQLEPAPGVYAAPAASARGAAARFGARAFATGNDVAFASTPTLHTVAHEAAHVVQQRAGVHLEDGLGETGDASELSDLPLADLVSGGP